MSDGGEEGEILGGGGPSPPARGRGTGGSVNPVPGDIPALPPSSVGGSIGGVLGGCAPLPVGGIREGGTSRWSSLDISGRASKPVPPPTVTGGTSRFGGGPPPGAPGGPPSRKRGRCDSGVVPVGTMGVGNDMGILSDVAPHCGTMGSRMGGRMGISHPQLSQRYGPSASAGLPPARPGEWGRFGPPVPSGGCRSDGVLECPPPLLGGGRGPAGPDSRFGPGDRFGPPPRRGSYPLSDRPAFRRRVPPWERGGPNDPGMSPRFRGDQHGARGLPMPGGRFPRGVSEGTMPERLPYAGRPESVPPPPSSRFGRRGDSTADPGETPPSRFGRPRNESVDVPSRFGRPKTDPMTREELLPRAGGPRKEPPAVRATARPPTPPTPVRQVSDCDTTAALPPMRSETPAVVTDPIASELDDPVNRAGVTRNKFPQKAPPSMEVTVPTRGTGEPKNILPRKPLPPVEDAPVTTPDLPALPTPPLTCQSLGDAGRAARAEKIVGKLAILISVPDIGTGGEVDGLKSSLELPTNEQIFGGIKNIDSLIEQNETDRKASKSALTRAKGEVCSTFPQVQQEMRQKRSEFESTAAAARRNVEARMKAAEASLKIPASDDGEGDSATAVARSALHDAHGVLRACDESVDRAVDVSKRMKTVANRARRRVEALDESTGPMPFPTSVADCRHGGIRSLVCSIAEENRCRAARSHEMSLDMMLPPPRPSPPLRLGEPTTAHWIQALREVQGPANALYVEPSENPLYDSTSARHEAVRHRVARAIRGRQLRLQNRWEELGRTGCSLRAAWESECGTGSREDSSVPSDGGGTPRRRLDGSHASGRNSYRRPRRTGSASFDVARSDYEQDQMIQELTEKEARIATGVCDLPRQCTALERKLFASFVDTQESRRVEDSEMAQRFEDDVNPWSDVEKCIFLDKFLQYPKDFRKISTYLRNKCTADCVRFYYDSKKSIQYKAMLQEYQARRKGHVVSWEITHQAARCVGAGVVVNTERGTVTFSLPKDENTFDTRHLHPLRGKERESVKEIVDAMDRTSCSPGLIDGAGTADFLDSDSSDSPGTPLLPQKVLSLQGDSAMMTPVAKKAKLCRSSFGQKEDRVFEQNDSPTHIGSNRKSLNSSSRESGMMQRGPGAVEKKPVQKWTEGEKKLFFEGFEKFEKDWERLEKYIRSKSIVQIKNYYQKNKVRLGLCEKKDEALPAPVSDENGKVSAVANEKLNNATSKGIFLVEKLIDSNNCDVETDHPHSPLTPRLELLGGAVDKDHSGNIVHDHQSQSTINSPQQQYQRHNPGGGSQMINIMDTAMQWSNHKYVQQANAISRAQDISTNPQGERNYMPQPPHQHQPNLQLQNMPINFAHHLEQGYMNRLNILNRNQMNNLHGGVHLPSYRGHNHQFHGIPMNNGLDHMNFSSDTFTNGTPTNFRNSERERSACNNFHQGPPYVGRTPPPENVDDLRKLHSNGTIHNIGGLLVGIDGGGSKNNQMSRYLNGTMHHDINNMNGRTNHQDGRLPHLSYQDPMNQK